MFCFEPIVEAGWRPICCHGALCGYGSSAITPTQYGLGHFGEGQSSGFFCPSWPVLPEDIVRFHTAVLVARAHNRHAQRVARHSGSSVGTNWELVKNLLNRICIS